MDDYRKRCYAAYVAACWSQAHASSPEEYRLFSAYAGRRFNHLLPVDRNSRILDLACGAGHFLFHLQGSGYLNSAGIDLSDQQLALAREMNVKNVEQADIFAYLPQHKNAYDMIIANDIVEHLRKPEIIHFFDLVRESLKTRGRVMVSTLNAESLQGAAILYGDFTHETGFTAASLVQVLKTCEFSDVSVQGIAPVARDLRSSLRCAAWYVLKKLLRAYRMIERGTGRGVWSNPSILEPQICAVARKRG
jgi:cyclopropane fatty-acyl-phospholipid synthase-like methyltransferase